MDSVKMLTAFGLTSQEAKLYIALHGRGPATGYELALDTGISRSNAYASLSSLVDKGAARVLEGKPQRFLVVPAREFCGNHIRRLGEIREKLEQELVLTDDAESPYVTITGSVNITDTIKTLIEETGKRIYLAMPAHILREFVPALESAAALGRKVTVVTTGGTGVRGATVHHARRLPDSVRVIADSARTLTGELDGTGGCSCLYSVKKNLVNLIRDSIRNEIHLIELEGPKTP